MLRCLSKCKSESEGSANAKAWLNVEDVPASIRVMPSQKSGKGVTLTVAGMDKVGLLSALDRAFHKRGFQLEYGEWAVDGVLFHGTFELTADSANHGDEPLKPGVVMELSTEKLLADETIGANSTISPSGQAVIFKVHVRHNMGDDLRVGLLAMVRQFGGRTMRGDWKTLPPQERQHHERSPSSDTFWVQCPHIEHLQSGPLASPEALQQHIQLALAALEQDHEISLKPQSTTSTTDMGQVAWSDLPREEKLGDLLEALRTADRHALQQEVAMLPLAVQHLARKVKYEIKGPSSWGIQVAGLSKYMGAGIVACEDAQLGKMAPTLQFTTLFVQDSEATWKLFRRFSALSADRCAEFVTSVDVSLRRFTIEKVFLNDICPSKCRIGARAIAEQIYAPVWEHGASRSRDLLPVHEVREIKLSDVINWNTYAVMAAALTLRGSGGSTLFPDMQWTLDQELKGAGLTLAQCKSLSLKDVLERTCLGNLITHVLASWCDRSGVILEIESVEVKYLQVLERIFGEYRPAMDITCKVCAVRTLHLSLMSKSMTTEVVEKPARAVTPEGATLEMQNKSAVHDAALRAWAESLGPGALEAHIARKRTLIDIAEFLDTGIYFSYDSDLPCSQPGATTLPHSREAAQSILSSMLRAVHELQRERAWSCNAAVEQLEDLAERSIKLVEQQRRTDAALTEALGMGEVVSTCVRTVSMSLILHRTLVDRILLEGQKVINECNAAAESSEGDSTSSATVAWSKRYSMLCERPHAFNILIGSLQECLIRSIKITPSIAASTSESLSLLCYFKEQLGRERAFVLCRGTLSDSKADEEGMKALSLMSATRSLIGDLLQSHKHLRDTLRHLEDAETNLKAKRQIDAYAWYNTISLCIDTCQELALELLGKTGKIDDSSALSQGFRNAYARRQNLDTPAGP